MLLDFSFKKNIVVFYVFEPLFDINNLFVLILLYSKRSIFLQ